MHTEGAKMNWSHEMRKHFSNEHLQKAAKARMIREIQPCARNAEDRLRRELR